MEMTVLILNKLHKSLGLTNDKSDKVEQKWINPAEGRAAGVSQGDPQLQS